MDQKRKEAKKKKRKKGVEFQRNGMKLLQIVLSLRMRQLCTIIIIVFSKLSQTIKLSQLVLVSLSQVPRHFVCSCRHVPSLLDFSVPQKKFQYQLIIKKMVELKQNNYSYIYIYIYYCMVKTFETVELKYIEELIFYKCNRTHNCFNH